MLSSWTAARISYSETAADYIANGGFRVSVGGVDRILWQLCQCGERCRGQCRRDAAARLYQVTRSIPAAAAAR